MCYVQANIQFLNKFKLQTFLLDICKEEKFTTNIKSPQKIMSNVNHLFLIIQSIKRAKIMIGNFDQRCTEYYNILQRSSVQQPSSKVFVYTL